MQAVEDEPEVQAIKADLASQKQRKGRGKRMASSRKGSARVAQEKGPEGLSSESRRLVNGLVMDLSGSLGNLSALLPCACGLRKPYDTARARVWQLYNSRPTVDAEVEPWVAEAGALVYEIAQAVDILAE
jgi:hypothetical protein